VRLFLLSNVDRGSGIIAGTPLLGVVHMSGAMPGGAGEIGASTEDKMESAVALLKRVLDLLDSANAPPELAARVSEALDAVAESRTP
jgi:hypothetical protein